MIWRGNIKLSRCDIDMVTDKIVNVVLPHLIQAHLQQHVDRGEACEGNTIHLLVVRLQDELTERAAAVPVDLGKDNNKLDLLHFCPS